jgi:hypothetical protein
MATTITMRNPDNGLSKDGIYGFSWTTLFFGGFPALFRGDFLTFIGYFVILVIAALVTAGIGSFILAIVWPFFYNKYYTKKLIEKGYRFSGSDEENLAAAKAIGVSLN